MKLLWLPLLTLPLLACDVPTPMAPAEPIGTVPTWGEGFTVPTEQPASMLGGAPPITTGPGGNQLGTTMGDTGDWGGGNVDLGKGVYTAMCARCHGALGEGSSMPGGITAPPFNDPNFNRTDREMARTIALGKNAMPSFMRDLDKPKLAGVIAYIKTLKKPAPPAP